MKSTQLIIPQSPSPLVIDDTQTSLLYWLVEYGKAEIIGSPKETVEAKTRDLQRFYNWFQRTLHSDDLHDWTKSMSKSYRTWLTTKGNDGKPFKATSANRFLATLRHAAKWIEKRRSFAAGDPFEGVKDIGTPPPPAKGFTPVQNARLRAAADKLLRLQTQKNQRPYRNYAIQSTLRKTAVRVTELCSLDYPRQYNVGGKHLHDVQRKGDNESPEVFIPQETREAIDEYITKERGTEPGPLFQTTTGGRMTRQQVHRLMKQLQDLANANIPADEHIHLSAHINRHARLKELADKDPRLAQRASGNKGTQHIARYTQPLDEDFERAAEEI